MRGSTKRTKYLRHLGIRDRGAWIDVSVEVFASLAPIFLIPLPIEMTHETGESNGTVFKNRESFHFRQDEMSRAEILRP
ncbi:MAG: hypothetical protein GY820_10670 [Gammaproteobacteria bacterium]|nr:hypothetical protein [Gammaproteobacteria bacterium]